MKKSNLLFTALLAFSTSFAWSKPDKMKKSLEFIGDSQSVETLFGSIRAVLRHGDSIVLAPTNKRFLITTPYLGAHETRAATFGQITDSKRVEMKIGKIIPNWRGMYAFDDRIVFLDGDELTLREVNQKSFETITNGSLIWDRILPARDRGGEAPNFEITKLRKKFKHAFLKSKGVGGAKVAGWTFWKNTKNSRIFYMTTFIEGFPLVQVECSKENPSACSITRSCNLNLPAKLRQDQIRGVAFSPSTEEILIANNRDHGLMRFKIKACNKISFQGMIDLPKKIFKVNNLFLDGEENLWVATDKPDNYFNASLYYWNLEQWSGVKTSRLQKSENSHGKANILKN